MSLYQKTPTIKDVKCSSPVSLGWLASWYVFIGNPSYPNTRLDILLLSFGWNPIHFSEHSSMAPSTLLAEFNCRSPDALVLYLDHMLFEHSAQLSPQCFHAFLVHHVCWDVLDVHNFKQRVVHTDYFSRSDRSLCLCSCNLCSDDQ